MRGSRARRAAVAVSTVWGLVLLAQHPAGATVNGPCTAQLAGVPITQGHDTGGTAIHVDYHDTIAYAGEATNGADVADVSVAIEIVGVDIRTTGGTTSGPTWESTVDVRTYAWAGVGLYRVVGTASTNSGPLCDGVAYVCVEGKSPFATVAGGVATALGVLALVMLARGVARRRRRGRAGLATSFGLAGVLGGVSAAVLLQQSCVLPLDVPTAVGFVGGGLVGLAIVGAAIAGPAMVPTAAIAREEDRSRERRTVYRFVPDADACNACRSHAAHRTYATMEAIQGDRAHEGCQCQILAEPVQDGAVMARFAGRTVVDDREG